MKYSDVVIDDLTVSINGTATEITAFDECLKSEKIIPLGRDFIPNYAIGSVDKIRRDGNFLKADVTTFDNLEIDFETHQFSIGYRLISYAMKPDDPELSINVSEGDLLQVSLIEKQNGKKLPDSQ